MSADWEIQETMTDEQYARWREAHRGLPYHQRPSDRCIDKIRHMSTRELLWTLKQTNACGGWYSPEGSGAHWGYSADDLKAELAERPHIPKRAEAKELRRKKALGHLH
jgi:hypothetical protein